MPCQDHPLTKKGALPAEGAFADELTQITAAERCAVFSPAGLKVQAGGEFAVAPVGADDSEVQFFGFEDAGRDGVDVV